VRRQFARGTTIRVFSSDTKAVLLGIRVGSTNSKKQIILKREFACLCHEKQVYEADAVLAAFAVSGSRSDRANAF
jgi:hypothetical protein